MHVISLEEEDTCQHERFQVSASAVSRLQTQEHGTEK
jgi:hypothetical protein